MCMSPKHKGQCCNDPFKGSGTSQSTTKRVWIEARRSVLTGLVIATLFLCLLVLYARLMPPLSVGCSSTSFKPLAKVYMPEFSPHQSGIAHNVLHAAGGGLETSQSLSSIFYRPAVQAERCCATICFSASSELLHSPT